MVCVNGPAPKPRPTTTSASGPPDPWPRSSGDGGLGDLIQQGGTLKQVRELFDAAFWKERAIRPEWQHLKLALLREDKPIMRLLTTWGAPVDEKDLAQLGKTDKYLLYLKLLRQCGWRIDLLPLEKTEPTPDKNNNASTDDLVIKAFIDAPLKDMPEFIDHRIAKLPLEWRKVLGTMQNCGGEEAVIAGGALRDLFNQRAIKDVDIFLQTKGSERKNRKFLKEAFAATGLDITTQITRGGMYGSDKEEKFLGPNFSRHLDGGIIRTNGYTIESGSESWVVVAGPDKTEYNIVFVNKPPHVRTAGNFGPDLIKSFDFGLCQIACNGQDLFTTDAYKNDITNRQITRKNGSTRGDDHLQRILKKYPDYQCR